MGKIFFRKGLHGSGFDVFGNAEGITNLFL